MVSNPHKAVMCLTEKSSTAVAGSMQKTYSAYSGLWGFPKWSLAFLVQDKQQRGKNQVHLAIRILKVKVDPFLKLPKELISFVQHQDAWMKDALQIQHRGLNGCQYAELATPAPHCYMAKKFTIQLSVWC